MWLLAQELEFCACQCVLYLFELNLGWVFEVWEWWVSGIVDLYQDITCKVTLDYFLQIKDGYYKDVVTPGYQSKILEGGVIEGQIMVSPNKASAPPKRKNLWIAATKNSKMFEYLCRMEVNHKQGTT